MFKRFKNLFLVMAILGLIFSTSYSGPVKEIQSIEEYSAQVLGDEEEDAEDTSQTIVMPKVKKVEKKEEIKKENEERDARLAKMTPKERAKAIVDEIFKDASDA